MKLTHNALNPGQPDSPQELEPLVTMTCSDYLDSLGFKLGDIIDEIYYEGSGYSLSQVIQFRADNDGVILSDLENLDRECHNAWKCAEKGLS